VNVLKPHLQTIIWTLLAGGASQREIERVTGIDRKTIRAYQKRFATAAPDSPGVATGSATQIPPPPPPAASASHAGTVSACELHRGFIEAQLRLRRNATEHWERKWAAPRIHGSARRQVQAMFEEERPLLHPLPMLGMQYFRESQRTVCDDTCVRIDHSSYAAQQPAPIGTLVLVRVFEHRIEIRDLKTQMLLRTHERVDRPGTVVLPMAERVFNPSRETRRLLGQAKAIGPDAERLCQMLVRHRGSRRSAQALGHREPGRALSASPHRQCLCARHRRWRAQL